MLFARKQVSLTIHRRIMLASLRVEPDFTRVTNAIVLVLHMARRQRRCHDMKRMVFANLYRRAGRWPTKWRFVPGAPRCLPNHQMRMTCKYPSPPLGSGMCCSAWQADILWYFVRSDCLSMMQWHRLKQHQKHAKNRCRGIVSPQHVETQHDLFRPFFCTMVYAQ